MTIWANKVAGNAGTGACQIKRIEIRREELERKAKDASQRF